MRWWRRRRPGTFEPLRPGDVTPLPPRGTPEHARLARHRRGPAARRAGGGTGRRRGRGDALRRGGEGAGAGGGRQDLPRPQAARRGAHGRAGGASGPGRSHDLVPHLGGHRRASRRPSAAGAGLPLPAGPPAAADAGRGHRAGCRRAHRRSRRADTATCFRALRRRAGWASGSGPRGWSTSTSPTSTTSPPRSTRWCSASTPTGGAAMTVEVTPRRAPDGKLDVGAAPVRVGGQLQLVEKVDPAPTRPSPPTTSPSASPRCSTRPSRSRSGR